MVNAQCQGYYGRKCSESESEAGGQGPFTTMATCNNYYNISPEINLLPLPEVIRQLWMINKCCMYPAVESTVITHNKLFTLESVL